MADGDPRSTMCRCIECSRGNDCERALPRRLSPPMARWRAPEGEEYRRRQEAIVAMMEEQ